MEDNDNAEMVALKGNSAGGGAVKVKDLVEAQKEVLKVVKCQLTEDFLN